MLSCTLVTTARVLVTRSCTTALTGAFPRLNRAKHTATMATPIPLQQYPTLVPVLEQQPATYSFGRIAMPASSVFFATRLSYVSVNQSPIMPGHVLVMPRSNVQRVSQLSAPEITDLWLAAQHVARVLETRLEADAMTFAIQDGVEAGQKVPCVHIHVIPRRKLDLVVKDDIYEMLDKHHPSPPPSDEQNIQASVLAVASAALHPANTTIATAPSRSVVPDSSAVTSPPAASTLRESLDDTKRVFHDRAQQAVEAAVFAQWMQEAGLPEHLRESPAL